MILIITACSNHSVNQSNKVDLTVSAAVSLKDALEDIKQLYEDENPHVNIRFNFGGSGSLQQQIAQGAPADIFFSAAEDKFNSLVEDGFIKKEDSTQLLKNELVLVAPIEHNGSSEFEDLLQDDVQRISIGTPDTVPAGKYAKEALEFYNLWSDLQSKFVYAKDVRQVLAYVETGNVEAGIVYKTDALLSEKVAIIATADPSSHSPISYPVGIIHDTKNYEAARDFYQYLQNQNSLEVFEHYGFITH
nr:MULTISPECIES: molybdate ABC transporter substrate-binding protein [Ornithinibacillus]